ncbi:hypothetical protein EJB05_50303, partial [Eragrostis curvula]
MDDSHHLGMHVKNNKPMSRSLNWNSPSVTHCNAHVAGGDAYGKIERGGKLDYVEGRTAMSYIELDKLSLPEIGIMIRIQENRTKAEKWQGTICPNIFKKLKLNIERCSKCHVLWNVKDGFEVQAIWGCVGIVQFDGVTLWSLVGDAQARKALCALRGMVKLQAMVRAQLVRRQANTTLRRMHCGSSRKTADLYQKVSPMPSALTDASARTLSGPAGSTTCRSSPSRSLASARRGATRRRSQSYMANMVLSHSKARSQSAPKQRIAASESGVPVVAASPSPSCGERPLPGWSGGGRRRASLDPLGARAAAPAHWSSAAGRVER